MKTGVALMALATGAFAAETSVNPIRKVVTLMQEMQKEVEAEGETEKELFEKFMCYCKGNNESLETQAADATAAGEEFRAKVEAETSEKKKVDQDLATAKSDRADAKADLAKATKLREKEHKEFVAENADQVANLEATKSAITALEKGMGASLLQTKLGGKLADIIGANADQMDVDDKETLASFLEQSKDYAPASGQIVGILKNMADEMEKALGETLEAEKTAVAGFEELKAAKTKEINATTSAVESLTKRSGELAVSIVQNKNSAEDAEEEGADAIKFLANLKKNCATKETEYDLRVKTRNEEIEAIGKAIAILNEDDALDLFKKTLKSPPTPAAAPAAFMQVRVNKADKVTEVRAILSAQKPTSANLALVQNTVMAALKSKAGKVDFSKVTKMIDDMVVLLGQEGKDDAKSLKWCQKEFDVSEDSDKELTRTIEGMASSISEMKDEIAALGDAIAAAEAKIVSLDKSVAEATEQRKKEHEEFSAMLSANQMAIELIGKAKNKLMQFYNPEMATPDVQTREPTSEERAIMAAGGEVDLTVPAAFVQIKMHVQESQPAEFEGEVGGEYKPKGKKSGGVMALMDNLIKELEVEVMEAENEEKQSQKDYEELTADAETSKAEEIKSKTTKAKAKADQENNLEETKRGKTLKDEALAELKTYVQELHGQCDFIMAHFEERKEARSKEIEGLKRAKAVLAGADYSF
jgi:hypothetical protein